MTKLKRKTGRPVHHEQWIEVTQIDGRALSTFYPPNAEFDRLLREMNPQPDLIYRRLNFVHGVPDVYLWTKPPDDIRIYGGHWLHRMLVKDWPGIMAAESLLTDHHLIPSPNPQPRPEIYGPCPCAVCTEERETGQPSRYAPFADK
jgi:hypothetical protein